MMGNHELNALLYHTKGPEGEWLRAHNEKNTAQHKATLDQIALSDPAEWKDWLNWMLKLPLWLDLGSCRIVHAAWDDERVQSLGNRDILTKRNLAALQDPSRINWSLVVGVVLWFVLMALLLRRWLEKQQ